MKDKVRLSSCFSLLTIMALLIAFIGCVFEDDDEGQVTSRAYKGHQSDADVQNFVQAFPKTAGTRLDDCYLCHTSGEVESSKGPMTVNACDYCHYVKTEKLDYEKTLNPFGAAYKSNGRSQKAFSKFMSKDSDGDGHSNKNEIEEGYFPGTDKSNPDKEAAPIKTYSLDEIKKMNSHTQFMLSNSHKQQFDDYQTYTGVTIKSLLKELNIDSSKIEGITIFAPDGYQKTFSNEQIYKTYPNGRYYTSLDDGALGEGKGFVNYPDSVPHKDLDDGAEIPDKQKLILAYERDFAPLSVSYIDPQDFRIQGEGPFRIVRPQGEISKPDRGSKFPTGDEYDYNDDFDHNAGDNVRGVTVIRIDPMPDKYEPFDAMNQAWSYLEEKQLVIYGYGIE